MKPLLDRINAIINTAAFQAVLDKHNIPLIEFQCGWPNVSGNDFNRLPPVFREAILAGEAEQTGERLVSLV